MEKFPDYIHLANLAFLSDLYDEYEKDPESIEPSWRSFFDGLGVGSEGMGAVKGGALEAYRRYGHLKAHINPLKEPPKECEELKAFQDPFLEKVYCSRIGFECAGLARREIEEWIQERIEVEEPYAFSLEEKKLILDSLNRSEVFERFLHTKYIGQTRFSLEGGETLIPILAEVTSFGAEMGIEEIVLGMAHRGRLNVLTNILEKPLETLFAEFEDDRTLSKFGNDDVRYHMGFIGEWKSEKGKGVKVQMTPNPSHLEAVNPIVIGQVYAKQKKKSPQKVLPLLIHGDASLAGQGVVYETLQLMNLPNYSVGGTLHIVVNNQIGYTTLPKEGRSTLYCTDIAKAFGCPVFHVNAEDPESCIYATKLALEIRQTFQIDVFLDLLCYRKYGHNEGDEPSYTQPLEYRLIKEKKPIREIYLQALLKGGALEKKMAEELEKNFRKRLEDALASVQSKESEPLLKGEEKQEEDLPSVSLEVLKEVIDIFCTIPKGFHPHPKMEKWLEGRRLSLEKGIDWASAECLAIGSLLKEKKRIRLAGQDAKRGTFSQRHMVWSDFETGESYVPFSLLSTSFEIVNSALSENAGMGFEFGFSSIETDSLTLWEAQYGDFFNGAQIVVDQFLACSEAKWNVPCSLVLLLPHGYEGAGPEHSSARIERFLQLAAEYNMRICYPSTPVQYFYLLREQAHTKNKRPMVLFTPKSLLRSPACKSDTKAFTKGGFESVISDPVFQGTPKRLLICSGKIFYDLLAAREKEEVAILRIEQLYPFPEKDLDKVLEKYRGISECFWLQEEPENMGAWRQVQPYLQKRMETIRFIGRSASATTATGSSKKHREEQLAIIKEALGKQ